MNKWYIKLLFIVLVATVLRFYQLGINSPSLTWDEVAWGYNAYSLGIDGKDEFGRYLPFDYLESFGDFKPPVYAYLDILPVKIFGLNEFAVRFPSAFFGVLTVLVTYFLTKKIFSKRGIMQNPSTSLGQAWNYAENIALISSFLLAISPWHINLSRAAFEANVATFFIVVGVWAFLAGVQEKKWYFIISAFSFVLSIYTFNTARVVVPLFVIILAISFRNELLKRKRQALIAAVVGILLMLPTIQFLLTPQARLRFQEVNIFSDIGVIERTNQEILNDNNSRLSKIIHNRRFTYATEYFKHYFDNLNPSFLFIKGDGNPKFSTQDVGQMYLWDLPFFIFGILLLFKNREGYWWIIPLWLIIGIIPAATARETPHALRIETTLPTFQIITAYGFVAILQRLSKIKNNILNIRINHLLIFMLSFILLFNIAYYLHGYYTHYPREYSGEWQYGYKESINYIESVKNDYNKIYFTDVLGRPYIYLLFYTKYDPTKFRENSNIKRDVFGFVHVNSFDRYIFDKTIAKNNKKEKILYIDKKSALPEGASVKKTFRLLNGEDVLVAYTI